MNDDNSDGKTEDELQSLFICDKNGNTYACKQKSPPTQNASTNNVSWHCANPDGMVVDYETGSDMDIGENISLNPQCAGQFARWTLPWGGCGDICAGHGGVLGWGRGSG